MLGFADQNSMDEMLACLTNGIGVVLGKEVRLDYFKRKALLTRHDKFSKLPSNQKNIVLDLLALTTFHEHVLIPIYGSMNFLLSGYNYNFKFVQMGSYELGTDHLRASEQSAKRFFAILKTYGIGIPLLHFSSADEFVEMCKELIKSNE